MLFSNKKEEVIDFKLTVHGRRLLSQGKLKPVYYAFYDDNIIYDSSRVSGSSANPDEALAGTDAIQNDIQKRIKEDSVYLKTQHNFSGRSVQNENLHLVPEREKNYILGLPIGKVDISAYKSPAWQATFMNNSSSAATINYENHSKHQTINIPQIESRITYKTAVAYVDPPFELPMGFRPDQELSNGTARTDGTYIAIDPNEYLLLNIEEENSVYMKENYDIEVYESGSEGWKKLDFLKRHEQIVDGFIVDTTTNETLPLDPSYVEYYFDVLVDKEIPESIVCKAVEKLKSKDIYIDTEVECPDLEGAFSINPYISDTPESQC